MNILALLASSPKPGIGGLTGPPLDAGTGPPGEFANHLEAAENPLLDSVQGSAHRAGSRHSPRAQIRGRTHDNPSSLLSQHPWSSTNDQSLSATKLTEQRSSNDPSTNALLAMGTLHEAVLDGTFQASPPGARAFRAATRTAIGGASAKSGRLAPGRRRRDRDSAMAQAVGEGGPDGLAQNRLKGQTGSPVSEAVGRHAKNIVDHHKRDLGEPEETGEGLEQPSFEALKPQRSEVQNQAKVVDADIAGLSEELADGDGEVIHFVEPSLLEVPPNPDQNEFEVVHIDDDFLEGERLRIQIEHDLFVEVTTIDEGVEVMVEGLREFLTPLQDIGPELERELERSGFSLNDFQTQEREAGGGSGGEGSSSGSDEAADDNQGAVPERVVIRRGHLFETVA